MPKQHHTSRLWALLLALASSTSGLAADYVREHPRRERADARKTAWIRPVPALPTVDGKLDDAVYKEATKITDFVNQIGSQGPTTLYLATAEKSLILAAVCEVPDITKVKAANQPEKRDAKVWSGDCLDFRIKNEKQDYQILIDSSASVCDFVNGAMAANIDFQYSVSKRDNAFVIETVIPFSELQLSVMSTTSFKLAVGRTDQNENIQTLTLPFGNVNRGVDAFVGSAYSYETFKAVGNISTNLSAALITDREAYGKGIREATGRITLLERTGTALKDKLQLRMQLRQGDKALFTETLTKLQGRELDFDLDIVTFPPGNYTLSLQLCDGDTVFNTVEKPLRIVDTDVADTGEITVTIPASEHELPVYPITFGVPFPEGALQSAENLRLQDATGQELPLQVEVTSRWSRNGPIRWALCDALVPVSKQPQALTLAFGPNVKRTRMTSLTVGEGKDTDGKAALRINTGMSEIFIPYKQTPGISQIQKKSGHRILSPKAGSGPYVIDGDGKAYHGTRDPAPEVVVETSGPLKAVVKVAGWHVAEDGARLGKYILRYHIFAQVPYIFADHTFIVTADQKTTYRDIGLAIPGFSARGFFGAGRIVPFDISGNESAHLLQRDDTCGKVVSNGAFMEDFGRASGWMSAGNLTVTMRDFWQNFPKELEATSNWRKIHFWPAHNEAATHTGDKLSSRNAYQLWFAHEGATLNFAPPQEVIDLVKKDGSNYKQMHLASPIGLAKTHHMLLHFHDGNWSNARTVSTGKVFQSALTAVVDPVWTCASKAFGTIAPKNDARFPQVEKAFAGTIKRFIRQQDVDRDYGMWNFGDAHHNWNWSKRRWRLYRTWRATHHNWTRWPWLHYIRSGDVRILDYARRNAEHVADISHCNYSDEANAKLPYPAGKMLGGICDYKGLVHWHAGNRLGYNSVADSLLNHFYITGDRRSLDVAINHGRALLKNRAILGGREASARITSLTALYQHSWDNDYLSMLTGQVERFASMARNNRFIETPNSSTLCIWTQGMTRYHDLTGSSDAQLFITHWADILSRTGANALFSHQDSVEIGISSVTELLASGYRLSGNERYLQTAAFKVDAFANYLFSPDDPRYRDSPAVYHVNRILSWFMYDAPYYLAAVAQHGKTPDPLVLPPRRQIPSLYSARVNGKAGRIFYARIRQPEEGPFEVRFKIRKTVVEGELKDLTSGTVYRASTTDTENGETEVVIAVPPDESLDYAFRLLVPAGYVFVPLPIANGQAGLKEVYPFAVPTSGRATLGGYEKFYFNVPEAVKNITFSYKARGGQAIELFASDGQRVLLEVTDAGSGPNGFTVPIDDHGRQGWSLQVREGNIRGKMMVWPEHTEGMDRNALWFGISTDKLFQPQEGVFDWLN